ncbi:MAG: LptA/OstA family protein [Alphaproteobacteria bacterium]
MRGILLLGVAALTLLWETAATAQQQTQANRVSSLLGPAARQDRKLQFNRNQPVIITADQFDYDREKGIVTARGKVEISQGSRVLTADRVHYDQRNKIVRAFGNVAVSDPSGPTVFAEMVELTDDL